MTTRLTLIRHGQTSWNVDGRWQGQANVGLNEEGFRQAEQLAEALAATDAVAIYSSDLRRAHQTAEAIATRTKLPLALDKRLREIDVGEWQGMTESEVIAWDGERLTMVRNGGFTMPRPSGESQQDVGRRMLALAEEVLQKYPEQHVILVAHGGSIRMLLHILNLLNETHRFIENTSRTLLHHDGSNGRWQMESFNLLDHLDREHTK